MEKKSNKTINKVLTTIGVTGAFLATGSYVTAHADTTTDVDTQPTQPTQQSQATPQTNSKVSQSDVAKAQTTANQAQTDADKAQATVTEDNNQITAQQHKIFDDQVAVAKAQQTAAATPEKSDQNKAEIDKQNGTVKNDTETVKHDQASVDHYQAGVNSAQQKLNDAQNKVNNDQSTVDNTQTQINNLTNQTQGAKITVPSANTDEMKTWTTDQWDQWVNGIKADWQDNADLAKEHVDLNNMTKAQYDEMQNQVGNYINQIRKQMGTPQVEVSGEGTDSLMKDVIDAYNKYGEHASHLYPNSDVSSLSSDYGFNVVIDCSDAGFSKDVDWEKNHINHPDYNLNQLSMNDVNHVIFSSVVDILQKDKYQGHLSAKRLMGFYDTGNPDNPTGAQPYYGVAFDKAGYIHIDGGHVNPERNRSKSFNEANAYNPLTSSQAEVDKLTDQLHQQKTILDNAKNKLIDAQNDLQYQQTSLKTNQDQLAKSQKQLQDDQAKLAQLNDEGNSTKLVADAQAQLKADQDQLTQLQAQKSTDESSLEKAQQALTDAKANLTKVQNQYATEQASPNIVDVPAKNTASNIPTKNVMFNITFMDGTKFISVYGISVSDMNNQTEVAKAEKDVANHLPDGYKLANGTSIKLEAIRPNYGIQVVPVDSIGNGSNNQVNNDENQTQPDLANTTNDDKKAAANQKAPAAQTSANADEPVSTSDDKKAAANQTAPAAQTSANTDTTAPASTGDDKKAAANQTASTTQPQVETAKTTNSTTAKPVNKAKALPNTGSETSSSLMAMVGMSMVSLAGLLGLGKYRKENK